MPDLTDDELADFTAEKMVELSNAIATEIMRTLGENEAAAGMKVAAGLVALGSSIERELGMEVANALVRTTAIEVMVRCGRVLGPDARVGIANLAADLLGVQRD